MGIVGILCASPHHVGGASLIGPLQFTSVKPRGGAPALEPPFASSRRVPCILVRLPERRQKNTQTPRGYVPTAEPHRVRLLSALELSLKFGPHTGATPSHYATCCGAYDNTMQPQSRAPISLQPRVDVKIGETVARPFSPHLWRCSDT